MILLEVLKEPVFPSDLLSNAFFCIFVIYIIIVCVICFVSIIPHLLLIWFYHLHLYPRCNFGNTRFSVFRSALLTQCSLNTEPPALISQKIYLYSNPLLNVEIILKIIAYSAFMKQKIKEKIEETF